MRLAKLRLADTAMALLLVGFLAATAVSQDGPSLNPHDGFVPDEIAAVKIAEAVLTPIYGAETVQKERPFKAVLNGDMWIVRGSLSKSLPGEIVMGGVAVVQLSKRTGRILKVGHGK